jgi:hypothetical protein
MKRGAGVLLEDKMLKEKKPSQEQETNFQIKLCIHAVPKRNKKLTNQKRYSLRCYITISQSIMQTTTTKGNTRIKNSSVIYNISSLN